MIRPDYIIGIDPDCEKSGLAVLSMMTRKVIIFNLPFPKLIEFIVDSRDNLTNLIVVVEAGWLSESHWHLKRWDNARLAAAKGNAVGRNHETGRKIVEMCRHKGLTVYEQQPLRKCWKGKEGKISHQEISQFIPGFPTRSNQETRDAALIAWNWAGFPMTRYSLKEP